MEATMGEVLTQLEAMPEENRLQLALEAQQKLGATDQKQ
jgi:hypothetical protein